MMELSDQDYKCVVAKIFEGYDENAGRMPINKVVNLISPYMGPKKSEFVLLKSVLNEYAIDKKIDQAELKMALVNWSQIVKNEKDFRSVKDVYMSSGGDIPLELDENSQCFSSEDLRDDMAELQNALSEKEYLVLRLQRQLELSAQHTQQQEEALAGLATQRDQLHARLLAEQSTNASLATLKQEYEELLDSLNFKTKTLQSNIDLLKKENLELNSRVVDLDNEKDTLSLELVRMDTAKRKALDLLSMAQSDKETLKQKWLQLTQKNIEQEKMLRDRQIINQSLEIELQNTRNKSTHCDKNHQSYVSDGGGMEPLGLDFNFTYLEEIENCDVSDAKGSNTIDGEVKNNSESDSKPRRNDKSLLQELSQINVTEKDFYSPSQRATSESRGDETNNRPDLVKINKNSYKAGAREESTESPSREVRQLKKQLGNEIKKNADLVLKLEKSSEEILMIKCEVEALKDRIAEMKTHENLLSTQNQCIGNSLNEVKTKIQMLKKNIDEQHQLNVQLMKLSTRVHTHNNQLQHYDCNTIETASELRVLETPEDSFMKSVGRGIAAVVGKLYLWGSMVCLVLGGLHLYNILKYTQALRSGTAVNFLPWNWMTLDEIINSIFDYKHSGQVPI